MVAQIDEQELAVIALAVHPARQSGGDAGIREAERAAGMGTIGVHREFPARRGKGAANTARIGRACQETRPVDTGDGGWATSS